MTKITIKPITLSLASILLVAVSCKKDDPITETTTPVTNTYTIPSTYVFTNSESQSTVSYSGQTDRLNQLRQMTTYMKTGKSTILDAQKLKDMFANTNDNGNGHFDFTSTKQLKSKCFTADVTLFESYLDSIQIASIDYSVEASNGQAGTLSTPDGLSTYLFNKSGIEPVQFIEKGLMGAVLMNQALNVYFGSDKMSADNSAIADAPNGKYYTALEHHWDEAFGYFGVGTDFPTNIPSDLWGKYCNNQNDVLGSNSIIMDNFLKGRAAISANVIADANTSIALIQNTWEDVSANQAIKYLSDAVGYFGTNQAKYLHALSEAYTFTWCLRYVPTNVRNITQTEHAAIMELYGENLWELTLADINAIKAAIDAKY